MRSMEPTVQRCSWALGDSLLLDYHDKEWGVPEHDENRLYELLVLEGAQAGLSWMTILRKREGYRRAFSGFDVEAVAEYGNEDIERLLSDPGIVRNRLKISAAIENAGRVSQVQDEVGSFDEYLWGFVGGKTIKNRFESLSELPSETAESRAMSKDLRKRGFRFVGPTICYAFMQAIGMVNDHLVSCFRHDKV